MPNAPANVIDALNSLLEAELSSAFRMIEGDFPYLSRANAELRKTIAELLQLSDRNARELADLIDSLGGVVIPHNFIQREGQYLAYLSLKFLLPKLVAERELALDRYKNTRLFIGAGQPEATAVLDHIIAEQEQCLAVLRKAAQSPPKSAISARA
jgi:hypothetical protein